MHRLVALSDPSAAIGVAVGLINDGKCAEAVAMLDLMAERHGASVAVLASRGTARALLGDLEGAGRRTKSCRVLLSSTATLSFSNRPCHCRAGAITDFDAAITMQPELCDFRKRRAQALAAAGRNTEALADLAKVHELASDPETAAEALADSAKIYQKARDYRRGEAAIKGALEVFPGRAQKYLPTLGACQVSQGDLEEGVATYKEALQAAPEDVDAVLNLGMALKEMSRVEDAEKVSIYM